MPKTNLKVISGKGKSNVEDDIDALFRLPLSDFIGARKTLSAKLKKEGRGQEAARVNALGKPSVSAWTVNQLYWQHRDSFDQLITTGQRLRQTQTNGRTGKPVDLRAVFDERRELLAHLSDLAAAVMIDAGHNPALDTLRRIATTLEAMSAYAALPEGVSAGRLTKDIDPPGFDSLAGFAASAATTPRAEQPTRRSAGKKSSRVEMKIQQQPAVADTSRLKKERQAKLAATKLWVQQTKRSMAAALARAKSMEAAQKKAEAETKEAEKRKREAERGLKEASAAADAATRRSERLTVELGQAREALRQATSGAEEASAELESLFRES
ncbi:MAG TPA: hypothetical protein VHQ64_12475 [Pyrinomonadaceae bacterium]|jgi:hypothetical protein|nr:hypothetical protein [Pyrinomonadaceae bacterium]